MRQLWSILLGVSLWLLATAGQAVPFDLGAIPVGPITSGNGNLQFSNFQFFSPFDSVDARDVTITALDDGIQLSGPLSIRGTGLQSFLVLYQVKALPLSGDIIGASLLLGSQVDANNRGLVLATKEILGPQLLPDPFTDWSKPGGGQGPNDLFPLLGNKLADLKTADWDFDPDSCDRAPLGTCDGAIRQFEAGFDRQSSITVMESISVGVVDGTATWNSSIDRFTTTVPVPEPGAASLMVFGLAMLERSCRRTRRRSN